MQRYSESISGWLRANSVDRHFEQLFDWQHWLSSLFSNLNWCGESLTLRRCSVGVVEPTLLSPWVSLALGVVKMELHNQFEQTDLLSSTPISYKFCKELLGDGFGWNALIAI